MQNELLLLLSFVVIYGGALLAYRLFGTHGLYAVNALATVVANIEVLLVINAFGMEQTLGNVLFAVTFLITDILSENEGKKAARNAVFVGIFASVLFLLISQSWLLYRLADSDWAGDAFHTLFSNTPRMLFASLSVYAISQIFDVWLYHAWWKLTERKSGDKRRFLWLRNNGSTLVSQLVNTVLFNLIAFWGTYDTPTLVSIIAAGYVVYIVTSLLDTPAVYIARKMKENGKIPSAVE
ncbi:MAG: queuosine precursor transporter [Oscillospiraceae bacterium]|jgi:uncharacterized integral membrane protein (TIGR00697 family)|nr:queuosine precursor transporter [Oscillospiraceae bacterium]